MKCHKCAHEIDDDSKYCDICGAEVLPVKQKKKRTKFYATETIENVKSEKGRNAFLLGFFGIDIVISTLIGFLHLPNLWVFLISAVVYMIAILLSAKGGLFAIQLRKKNKPMTGFGTAIIIAGASMLMMTVNIYTVYQYLVL